MRLRCDCCGVSAPDEVAPILHGIRGWREFEIDGVHEGKPWVTQVLLCPGHREQMEAFVESGGLAGHGPKPPPIRTARGGQETWEDAVRKSCHPTPSEGEGVPAR